MCLQKKSGNVLIAYFSRAGENYNVGYLKVGNTAVMAGYIHERLSGSDIFRIGPVVPYPDKYDECTEVAKKEQRENVRPTVKTHIPDINKYDIIYIGYPILDTRSGGERCRRLCSHSLRNTT